MLFTSAKLGASAHFDDNWQTLVGDPRWQSLWEWVEQTGAAAAGIRAHDLTLTSYEQALRQMHAVAERISQETLRDANVHLVKEAHALLRPTTKVRLAIDGMLIPAWVKQVGKRNTPEAEAAVRGTARNAGVRSYAKRQSVNGEAAVPSRFVRGYYLITLVDLTTGLPLTGRCGTRTETRRRR